LCASVGLIKKKCFDTVDARCKHEDNFHSLRKDKHATTSLKLHVLASDFYVFSELGSRRMSHYFNIKKSGNANCKQCDFLFLISRFF